MHKPWNGSTYVEKVASPSTRTSSALPRTRWSLRGSRLRPPLSSRAGSMYGLSRTSPHPETSLMVRPCKPSVIHFQHDGCHDAVQRAAATLQNVRMERHPCSRVRQVKAGDHRRDPEGSIQIFDKTKPTCLTTDWSKDGVGYWLFQKHCTCPTQDIQNGMENHTGGIPLYPRGRIQVCTDRGRSTGCRRCIGQSTPLCIGMQRPHHCRGSPAPAEYIWR